jgi:hypothetical protein
MSSSAAAPSQPAETDAPPCVAAIDSTVPGWSRLLVERQLAVLGRLAEAGLNIALAVEGRAAAAVDEAAPMALDDVALAYDRVARAVRRTIALQSERIAHLQAPDAVPASRDEATTERKATVGHIVRRLANKQHRPDFTDRIGREARDWLEDENIYGDILAHPVSEIIDWICRDLGLSPDWVRLAQEAWAQEELQSGAVGYPLKGHKALDPPMVARPFSPAGKAANVKAASP